MRRLLVILALLSFCAHMAGCAKKETGLEETEQISMEALSSVSPVSLPGAKPVETKAVAAQPVVAPAVPALAPAPKLEPLPPAGPYKPASTEIQTALKNAGHYSGVIDGKIGPMSKKAITEFQKAAGLEADGKVGPKTWAALSKYLNPTTQSTTAPSQKR